MESTIMLRDKFYYAIRLHVRRKCRRNPNDCPIMERSEWLLSWDDVIDLLSPVLWTAVWLQKEAGERGYQHWQITLETSDPYLIVDLEKLLHIRKRSEYCAYCKDPTQSVKYCQKPQTRIGRAYHFTRQQSLNALDLNRQENRQEFDEPNFNM